MRIPYLGPKVVFMEQVVQPVIVNCLREVGEVLCSLVAQSLNLVQAKDLPGISCKVLVVPGNI